MSSYDASQLASEFARAAPTTGFGEIEATVIASLSAPGAPRPRPINTKPERKLCRIFSPVSTTRDGEPSRGIGRWIGQRFKQDNVLLRPHTADAAVTHRPRATPSAMVADEIGTTGTNIIPNTNSDDVAGSARLDMVQQRGRPMTSDASSHLRNHQNRGADGGRLRGSLSRFDNDSGEGDVWKLRASTPCGSRRRPPSVSHGSFDARQGKSSSTVASNLVTSLKNQAIGERNERQQHQQHNHQHQHHEQQQDRPEQEAPEQHEQAYAGRTTRGATISRSGSVDRRPSSHRMKCRNGESSSPPNRYWPVPGGAKEFLRPFIERNQKQLWAFDPAFMGKNHVEVYRHIVSEGNFEAVKRTLLEKEDALTRGTGSFLMADTIERFRGGSARRPASSVHSAERSPGRSSSPRPGVVRSPSMARGMTAIELDPFQCRGPNTEKLDREATRRRDLLSHAKARSNVFCRRKGYEPGDFLKQPAARLSGEAFSSSTICSRRRSSGTNSVRSAAAAAAAAETRRRVHRHKVAGGA